MRLDALVINLNRFGDLLLSQPLLHDLHKAGRSTTLLCLEKYADTEGLLQFASPLLTVPDHLVSPEQAPATNCRRGPKTCAPPCRPTTSST